MHIRMTVIYEKVQKSTFKLKLSGRYICRRVVVRWMFLVKVRFGIRLTLTSVSKHQEVIPPGRGYSVLWRDF